HHFGPRGQADLGFECSWTKESERRLHRHDEVVALRADDVEKDDCRPAGLYEPFQARCHPQHPDTRLLVQHDLSAVKIAEYHIVGAIGGESHVGTKPATGL